MENDHRDIEDIDLQYSRIYVDYKTLGVYLTFLREVVQLRSLAAPGLGGNLRSHQAARTQTVLVRSC